MSVYENTTIGGMFDGTREGSENAFNKAVAEWVTLFDGEIGVWTFTETKGNTSAKTTVVGFYSRISVGDRKANESIIGFWTVTETWSNASGGCTCCSRD